MERKLKHIEVPSSEITPQSVYLSRRDFLKAMGIVSAAAFLAACGLKSSPTATPLPGNRPTPTPYPLNYPRPALVPDDAQGQTSDELGNSPNTLDQITHYNNYYEFTTGKNVADVSGDFNPVPWSVEVGGLVHNPKTYAIEDLLKFEQKERIYRLRCVEAWSMVIPWTGFELSQLLKDVEPMTSAKYVRFTTLMDPQQMPGESDPFFSWPYTEGLRLDEAMHRLTIIATGLYGQSLPNQSGAPLRLVVPWKYGFKSVKAIVKIELTEQQPATFWDTLAPDTYGFYSNVNPYVNRTNWPQDTERRIGESGLRQTLLFNGYGYEVASLYSGMSLNTNY